MCVISCRYDIVISQLNALIYQGFLAPLLCNNKTERRKGKNMIKSAPRG
ncbi:hypothetical protein PROPEN_03010 [Proteus penneri ATCC 35198]|nr:hypothetical protein PROPEN_03010 [Proteus penneri ATCC 35198]